jgi:AcrR family transcriptional regulator
VQEKPMNSHNRPGGGHAVSLSRAAIIEAAQRQAAESGLESLSSRMLATQLGVTPMALYRHVRDMDEVFGAVVDRVLGDIGTPDPSEDWRDWLEHLAQGLHRLFQEHPAALGLFTRQPVTTPAARLRLTSATAVLTAAGFSPEDAERFYAAVHTYTIGFCALEVGRRGDSERPVPLDAAEDRASVAIRGFVTEEQFLFGLRALVSGLAASVEHP